METMETLKARRSVRKYKSDPLPEPLLREILEAGMYAPSAVNMQHWYFLAIQSPETLD